MTRPVAWSCPLVAALLACSSAADPTSPPAALTVGPAVVKLDSGGLRLEEQTWTLGPDAGLAWRASVALPGHAVITALDEVGGFETLLPSDPGPWAAINGGFYDTDARAMGLVVSGGVERHSLQGNGGSGVFFVGPTGPRVVKRDQWQPGPAEALQSIDRLIDQGASLVAKLDGKKAARSAVVVGETRLWLVALADGPGVETIAEGVQLDDTIAHGLSLGRFAEYLIQTTDAVEALNLDGAVSTQLAVRTPDGRFEVRGERGTINAVVLRP